MDVSAGRGEESATVSVLVRVAPDVAFDVFTKETDLWWRKGPKFRIAGRRRGTLAFEPGPGGRLFETFESASGTDTFATGTITLWEPPRRLAFEWRGVNYEPGQKTLVEVGFERTPSGTLVTVRHSGFSALPAGHPARHGLVGPDFSSMMAHWWGELASAFREYVETRRREGAP